METITTLTLPTHELQAGDIVLSYGMRILLDQAPKVYHSKTNGCYHASPAIVTHDYCRVVYSWLGLVTNPGDVRAEGTVPMSWLRHHSDTEDRWNVQGNSLATWEVERL